MSYQYDEMQGIEMDVKDHPERVMPKLEDMVSRGRSIEAQDMDGVSKRAKQRLGKDGQ